MSENIDLYSGLHKGQRRTFFNIALKAGTLDYADQATVEKLYQDLLAFREEMRLHAALEEKLIHPLLADRVPGGARRLEEDHRVMHQQFNDIIALFEGIKAKPADFEKNRALVMELYRSWNRFVAFYFTHIDFEEENVMPTLWKLCTTEELVGVFKHFLANQTPKELMGHLEMMLPAMNLNERIMLLSQGKANMPPEAFQAVLKVAEQALGSEDWKILKAKLSIG